MHSVEKYVSFLKYAYLPVSWRKRHDRLHDNLLFIRVLEGLGPLDRVLALGCDSCATTKASDVTTQD